MASCESYFTSFDGTRLHRRRWLPPGRPAGIVCFLHGAFEHSGRFNAVSDFLAGCGYQVESFDLRGHGKSEGEITPETPFVSLVRDIGVFIRKVREEHGGAKVFLLGQSLGGALAVIYASDEGAAGGLKGVILCAPACRLVFPPLSILAMCALVKFLPGFKIKELEAKLISRDPAVVLEYENDPLVNRQGIPVRPLSEFMRLVRTCRPKFEQRDVPLLLFHGTADKIVDIRGSRELFCRSVSTDKRLEQLPGFYHDLLNDPGKELIFRQLSEWLAARS